jgi:hypothetical protein
MTYYELYRTTKVDEAINNTNKENWIPVSPDTRLFNIGKAPYSRIEGLLRLR